MDDKEAKKDEDDKTQQDQNVGEVAEGVKGMLFFMSGLYAVLFCFVFIFM